MVGRLLQMPDSNAKLRALGADFVDNPAVSCLSWPGDVGMPPTRFPPRRRHFLFHLRRSVACAAVRLRWAAPHRFTGSRSSRPMMLSLIMPDGGGQGGAPPLPSLGRQIGHDRHQPTAIARGAAVRANEQQENIVTGVDRDF